jgi:PHP family Zn ribbon phosphoesterase
MLAFFSDPRTRPENSNPVQVPSESGNCFEDLRRAIKRQGGSVAPTQNIGFYPVEGKYKRTACTRCYRFYSPEEMKERWGRCE